MRQSYIVIPLIESFVDFFGKIKGVDKTILAGGTLARNHGTNQRTCAARFQTMLSKESNQSINILIFYALYFHRKARGHSYLAAAKTLGALCYGVMLGNGYLSVAGNNTHIEHIGEAFVL